MVALTTSGSFVQTHIFWKQLTLSSSIDISHGGQSKSLKDNYVYLTLVKVTKILRYTTLLD